MGIVDSVRRLLVDLTADSNKAILRSEERETDKQVDTHEAVLKQDDIQYLQYRSITKKVKREIWLATDWGSHRFRQPPTAAVVRDSKRAMARHQIWTISTDLNCPATYMSLKETYDYSFIHSGALLIIIVGDLDDSATRPSQPQHK
jgi:hypothetical protein